MKGLEEKPAHDLEARLDVEQGSFQHQGFEGLLKIFLERARSEVLEARSRYPQNVWKSFDVFLENLEHVLAGESTSVLTLEVRDPSGLSHVDSGLPSEVKTFERSVREDWALGVEYPRPAQRSDAKSLAQLVRKSSRIVALSGAGISVESGITPFRSKDGEAIWADFDPNRMTVSGFNNDPSVRVAWWAMKRKLQSEMSAAKANPAHSFFGMLEQEGKLHAVITQNIDSLHQKGGVPDSKVNELHGHMRGVICADRRSRLNPEPFGEGNCDYACDLDSLSDEAVPSCPKCSAPLRTETVMFEQAMPDGAVESAREAILGADLLIIIGSTLIVAPANELPGEALRRGTPVVMVNFDETRYDQHVDVLLRRPAGEVFEEVAKILSTLSDSEDTYQADPIQVPSDSKDDTTGLTCFSGESPEETSDDEQLYGDDDFGE